MILQGLTTMVSLTRQSPTTCIMWGDPADLVYLQVVETLVAFARRILKSSAKPLNLPADVFEQIGCCEP